jgi:5'-nucleotidase
MGKNILITNDDGINAPALDVLKERLSGLGRVIIVVPSTPKNAMGNSLTLHKPVRVNKLDKDRYSVTGTTADCVRIGVLTILNDSVDILISGINDGANLGDDIGYSGTVGGAREGALLGIPSMASSLVVNKIRNFAKAADITLEIVKKMVSKGVPRRRFLNLNVPDIENVKGITVTRMGIRKYDRKVYERIDPVGRKYYWLVGEKLDGIMDRGTDFEAISKGYASITPVSVDYTDTAFAEELKNWSLG